MSSSTAARVEQVYRQLTAENHRTTDRIFRWLLVSQWLGGIVIAMTISPRTWQGSASSVHVHVWAAVLLGGTISLVPCLVSLASPGSARSRHVIAIAQSLTSALLIHLTGGRIETHFHIFGSLAFLAFYRDWRVLLTASLVVGADHLVRGFFWPESVFGVLVVGRWRWLEHLGWVLFEDAFLIRSCLRNAREVHTSARRQAQLERSKEMIDDEVEKRTAELLEAYATLKGEMERRTLLEGERDSLNQRLVQAQKLESVGQLAAGIAHEINTPTQYVGDNTRFLRDAVGDFLGVLEKARELCRAAAASPATRELAVELEAAFQRADIDFLRTEAPRAIEQSLEGIARVTKIVRAMKDYAHPGGDELRPVDLNRAIESTATVARNEWKYVADVEFDLDPELPAVPCLAGEVNQVLLNMIVNAAHAIEEVHGERGRGTIRLSTRARQGFAEIRVGDDGAGMEAAVKDRIFDPFFTTKEVGKGTGQGLSIAYTVIVQKHAGAIEVESEPGVGTTFVIRLPLTVADARPCAA